MNDKSYLARIKSDAHAAESYLHRKPGKHRGEMAMIAEAFAGLEQVQKVLDAPCGVGRATIWFASQGYNATGIDLGDAALQVAGKQLAAAGFQGKIEKQNIFKMTYLDKSFDAVLCFRLIHHFPELAMRNELIQELSRVSARYVVLSYISPCSFTSLRRKLRNKLSGTPIKQYPSTLAEIEPAFAKAGFKLHKQVARNPFLHSLQMAVFKREH